MMGMIDRLMGDQGEIVRTGVTGRDKLNAPITGVISRTRTRARLEQIGTSEGDNDNYVVDRWRVLMPAGTDLRAGDTFESAGRKFTVEGSPSFERVPGHSAVSHVSAILKYVGGVK